jgi:glycosyltransferase involved in cell wall biosynthesis
LQAAVDSVLAQSHPNVEAIVVNDGSPDETDAVAARFGNKIRYIRQINKGVSAARNAGICAATGDYLLFLDADDLLHPDALRQLVIAVHGRPNCMGIMGFRFFSQDPPADNPFRSEPCVDVVLLPRLIQRGFGPPHCYMCSRAMVLAVGGFEEDMQFWGAEDRDLWLRLAFNGAIAAVAPLRGAYYRRYAGSVSTNIERMLSSHTNVFLRIHQLILDSENFIDKYGTHLLEAEYRLRRRWIARNDHAMVRLMDRSIVELQNRGVQLHGKWKVNLLQRLLGRYSERFIMQCFRRLKPETFAGYINGYC